MCVCVALLVRRRRLAATLNNKRLRFGLTLLWMTVMEVNGGALSAEENDEVGSALGGEVMVSISWIPDRRKCLIRSSNVPHKIIICGPS